MKSVVKIKWKKPEKKERWKACLKLAGPKGHDKINLDPGKRINFEITEDRICTGYHPEPGKMELCPDFSKIGKGSKCKSCRRKDIYSEYVKGNRNSLQGKFSVYMAQLGEKIKVGVTRSDNIPKRWIEQGADYAAELITDLDSNEALEKEKKLDVEGVTQRVMKERKVNCIKNEEKLKEQIEKTDYNAKIKNINKKTAYGHLKGQSKRKGLISGEIQSVKGQIISNGRIAMIITSGRALKEADQQKISRFNSK